MRKWMITSFYKQFFRQPKVAWAFLRWFELGRNGGLNLEKRKWLLKRWFELGKEEMDTENEIQKN